MNKKITEFDELTKQRIKNLFSEKFKQKQPKEDWQFLEFEASVFLKILEGYGLSIPEFKQYSPPRQQKRKETIRSMGLALSRCVNQFAALDSGARGYACFLGVEEISNTIGKPKLFPEKIPSSLFVDAHKDDVIKELRAFIKGVLKAADELPEKPEPIIELRMALWIKEFFRDYGFEFTTSQTGFSAECLRAVLDLGGIHKDRVDYWLTVASNNEYSMDLLTKLSQNTNEKSG